MTNIHFIVNPIAGKGSHNLNRDFLSGYFPEEAYRVVLKHSRFKRHAIALAEESIKEGADIIVACGGDGTIHEIASCLVNSPVHLGIIPIGSGNGLASSLHIPKDIRNAIGILKGNNATTIDVGQVNGSYFFSNMGIGFDAAVIHNFEQNGKRRFGAYLKAAVRAFFNYHVLRDITLEVDGERRDISPFMFFISNSKIMGYNLSLTKDASLRDGLLDIVLIEDMSRFKLLWLGVLILLRRHWPMKGLIYKQVHELKLTFKNKNETVLAQQDGESLQMREGEFRINVLPNAISVML
jgi:YegS/Rv2252/BmrU family lipid kinase